MKKTTRRILVAAAAVLVALLLFVQFGLGFVVKHGAQTIGSSMLGCDVAITNCHMRLLTGVVDMRGVVVGPPEGFDANLFEMDRLRVDFSPLSLLGSGPFVIHGIAVTNVLVSYELKGLDSNISAVLEKLGANDGPEAGEGSGEESEPVAPLEDEPPEEAAEEASDDDGGKKVVIERFVFAGAKVRAAFWDGTGLKPPLPTIELTDVGKKSGGATVLEAVGSVFKSIGRGVIGLVADLGGALVDAASSAGSGGPKKPSEMPRSRWGKP